MTEIEVAEFVIKKNGDCLGTIDFTCDDCPAKRIYKEKELSCCGCLWDYDEDKCKQWFENFLK